MNEHTGLNITTTTAIWDLVLPAPTLFFYLPPPLSRI